MLRDCERPEKVEVFEQREWALEMAKDYRKCSIEFIACFYSCIGTLHSSERHWRGCDETTRKRKWERQTKQKTRNFQDSKFRYFFFQVSMLAKYWECFHFNSTPIRNLSGSCSETLTLLRMMRFSRSEKDPARIEVVLDFVERNNR